MMSTDMLIKDCVKVLNWPKIQSRCYCMSLLLNKVLYYFSNIAGSEVLRGGVSGFKTL